jgi:hypothetical protein
MKKDHLAEKEYRYGCSIDCGGTPLRVYARDLGSQGSWTSIENRMSAVSSLWYGVNQRVSYPAGNLILMGSDAGSIAMDHKDSAGLPVGGYLPVCDEETLIPMPCIPADCWMREEGLMLSGSGTGSLAQFGLNTNHYYTPNFLFTPILMAALRGCLSSVGIDVIESIGRWLICAIGSYLSGKPISGCGSFPVPSLCDVIANCLAGALSGGLLEKLLPPKLREKLNDFTRDIVAGGLGRMIGGGICDSIASPAAPCPPTSPTPRKPKPVGGGAGGWVKPYPAY